VDYTGHQIGLAQGMDIGGGARQKLGEIAVEGGERVDSPTGSST
jgi:hypothetical protein